MKHLYKVNEPSGCIVVISERQTLIKAPANSDILLLRFLADNSHLKEYTGDINFEYFSRLLGIHGVTGVAIVNPYGYCVMYASPIVSHEKVMEDLGDVYEDIFILEEDIVFSSNDSIGISIKNGEVAVTDDEQCD